MKIGNVELPNNVVLAPMAGVSNKAFRLIAREFGVGLVVTEMVSDKAILHGNDNTLKMLEIGEDEKPISIQLFGSEATTLAKAAKYVEENTNADIIDINMGCPVPKVVKSGAGSKLLMYPDKIEEIVTSVVNSVNIPVTVKIRIGWDYNIINAIENAKRIERAGASAIAVHGRTREQMYTGHANWNIIKSVKGVVRIPVIGNGDINSPESAKRMIDITGVDGVMIGRAALGNPWVLYRTVKFLKTGILYEEPTPKDKINIAFNHLDKLIEIKGELLAVKEMRKHAGWYLKGLPNSASIREKINYVDTKKDLKAIILEYISQIEN